ncbi:MAG: NUDIX hydrolase [Leptolyngbyaceae cyanobacterium]
MEWKTLKSQVVFSHLRLTLLEDEVELPNGYRTTYLKKAPGPGSVTIIAERSDGKILMQKEYSYPPQKRLYQFPGGKIEPQESPENAAVRELIEESDLKANQIQEIGKYLPDNRRSAAYMYVFHAHDLSPMKGDRDPEEYIESFWFEPDDLNQMIRTGEIENCHILAAWKLYESKRSK